MYIVIYVVFGCCLSANGNIFDGGFKKMFGPGINLTELEFKLQATCVRVTCMESLLSGIEDGSIPWGYASDSCNVSRNNSQYVKFIKAGQENRNGESHVWFGAAKNRFTTMKTQNCNGICKLTGFGTFLASFYKDRFYSSLLENTFFSVTFDTIIAPVTTFLMTVIFNVLNLSIMNVLLGKQGAGAAIYFHKAEIISDLIMNIVMSLRRLHGTEIIFLWFFNCFTHVQFTGIFAFIGNGVIIFNQLMLVELVKDRLEAVKMPFAYNARNHKQCSRKVKKMAVIQSVAVCIPMVFSSIFNSTTQYWLGEYGHYIIDVFMDIYTFLMVFQQIYLTAKLQRQYKISLSKMPNDQERLKKERDKNGLLWGTVVLNVSILCFTQLLNVIFFVIWRLSDKPAEVGDVWRIVEYRVNPFLYLLNGSIGVVIHLLTVKSYKAAFKKTKFGKVLVKLRQNIGGNQVIPIQ